MLAFKALWDRFEFVHTPKHGSRNVRWTVMIRQCLNRRTTPSMSCAPRSPPGRTAGSLKAKVNWQDDARIKLKTLSALDA